MYDPLCDKNQRDRRSVRPCLPPRCASGVSVPRSAGRGTAKPFSVRNGAVWKAPGGDGGNLQIKRWRREKEREREKKSSMAINGATIQSNREAFLF